MASVPASTERPRSHFEAAPIISIQKGKQLSQKLGTPFVHGQTRNRMEVFNGHRVVIGSRVADEGLSMDDLECVIEYDFHGGSRRQEAQRVGRVMHGNGEGEHVLMMTDEEYERHGSRLYSLEEQGFNIRIGRGDRRFILDSIETGCAAFTI